MSDDDSNASWDADHDGVPDYEERQWQLEAGWTPTASNRPVTPPEGPSAAARQAEHDRLTELAEEFDEQCTRAGIPLLGNPTTVEKITEVENYCHQIAQNPQWRSEALAGDPYFRAFGAASAVIAQRRLDERRRSGRELTSARNRMLAWWGGAATLLYTSGMMWFVSDETLRTRNGAVGVYVAGAAGCAYRAVKARTKVAEERRYRDDLRAPTPSPDTHLGR